jgi:hypothetical protein
MLALIDVLAIAALAMAVEEVGNLLHRGSPRRRPEIANG